MRRKRFIGYDLNGRRDLAARSWLIKPGEEEELEGEFIVSGGLNGAVVRVDDEGRDQYVGGALARLAPQGRGPGWGSVGAIERRVLTYDLVQEPERYTKELPCALSALGGGADVAVASMDDVPGIRETQQEAFLRAMRDIRNRRVLHVWRPVLATLATLEDGLLDGAVSVVIISQAAAGLSTQCLKIRDAEVRAPERRQPGKLHECSFGFDRFLKRARDFVEIQVTERTREEELKHLETTIRMAMGFEPRSELYKIGNGDWVVAPELESPSFDQEQLPKSVEEEIADVDAIIVETLAEGPVRAQFAALVSEAADEKPLVLSSNAVARGALIAAQRFFWGKPVYFDFLPQISTIVQDVQGPKNFDLIPHDAMLPAGKIYRSEVPAQLGLQSGQTQITVYLNKELEERPRKANLALQSAPERMQEIRCLVEQAPAQGRARIMLESDLFQAPMTIDWDSAEEVEQDWDTVLKNLETPKPTIPNRLILRATHELWIDQRKRRPGLSTLMKKALSGGEPNWADLANKLCSREGGAYCVSSDGYLPEKVSNEDRQLLADLQRKALEHTLARANGTLVDNDNNALRFLTWLFKRCDEEVVAELLKALLAQTGGHPFVFSPGNRKLIYQGLGRILSDGATIRKVLDHLLSLPDERWNSTHHVACAAFLLSRNEEAPQLLERTEVDTLARIGVRILRESIRRDQYNTLHYPPFLLVGLLRWRLVDNWALVAGEDPVADTMLKAVEYALPSLDRQSETRANLRKLHNALSDVREELMGEGRNPNLLMDLATI